MSPKSRKKASKSASSSSFEAVKSPGSRSPWRLILIILVVLGFALARKKMAHSGSSAPGAPAGASTDSGDALNLVDTLDLGRALVDFQVTKAGDIYSLDGEGLGLWRKGTWVNRLKVPWQVNSWNFVAVSDDAVFVTRPGSPILYKSDLSLKKLQEIHIEGAMELTGVAALPGDKVAVADVTGDALFIVDEQGKVLSKTGSQGGAPLKDPRALGLGDDGEIYVVDTGLDQVLRFDLKGQLIKAVQAPWINPSLERIAASDGRFYINNHLGGGVWSCKSGGGGQILYRRSVPDFPLPGPAQLTIGKDGFLYVGSSVVGKFKIPG